MGVSFSMYEALQGWAVRVVDGVAWRLGISTFLNDFTPLFGFIDLYEVTHEGTQKWHIYYYVFQALEVCQGIFFGFRLA